MKQVFLLLVISLLALGSCGQQRKPDVTLNTKIGQMIEVGFRGLQAPENSSIAKDIRQHKIGSIVLFDYDVPSHSSTRNIKSPEQLHSLTGQLQQYADVPLFITIDQEGGEVSRLKEKFGFPPTVSEQYLGQLNNMDSTRYYARQAAQILQKAGINVDLAPVVDLNINPKNPVIGGLQRSYSADPDVVTQHAKAFIEELHKKGILTTLKHFPGHGSSKTDSHKGLVDVTQTWQKKELLPYKRLIKSGDVDIIMTAHIFNARIDSLYPATLSQPTITGMLRDSLGFKGVVMSDDMQMGAIRQYYGLKKAIKLAIRAGDDILTFGNNSVYDPEIAGKAHRIIKELVENGEISKQRIDQSYQRIMKLKERISK